MFIAAETMAEAEALRVPLLSKPFALSALTRLADESTAHHRH